MFLLWFSKECNSSKLFYWFHITYFECDSAIFLFIGGYINYCGTFFFFFFFFFFLGGVAMVLQHRYFIQKILGTSTICSHEYGFDMP